MVGVRGVHSRDVGSIYSNLVWGQIVLTWFDTEDVTESKLVQGLMFKMTLNHQGRLHCDHQVPLKTGQGEVYCRTTLIKVVKIIQGELLCR